MTRDSKVKDKKEIILCSYDHEKPCKTDCDGRALCWKTKGKVKA